MAKIKVTEVGLDVPVKEMQVLLETNDCVLVVADVKAAIKEIVMVCLSPTLTAAVPELLQMMQTYGLNGGAMLLAGTRDVDLFISDLCVHRLVEN